MIYDVTDINLVPFIKGLYGLGNPEGARPLEIVEAVAIQERIREGEFIDYHNGVRMKIDAAWKKGRLLLFHYDEPAGIHEKRAFAEFMKELYPGEELKTFEYVETLTDEDVEFERDLAQWGRSKKELREWLSKSGIGPAAE